MFSKKIEKLVMISVFVIIAMMLGASLSPVFGGISQASATQSSKTVPSITDASSSLSVANWTYPTTTMQEPGYTNGTYKVAATNNVGHLNIWDASSLYDFLLLDEIYGSPTALLPNSTISPWLATDYNQYNLTTNPYAGQAGNTNHSTYDPLTGQWTNYSYVWVVHIRPGVQWTDWNSSNAASTYTYSNTISFNNTTGTHFTHTYSWAPVTMKTHYVQSADFIMSWLILQSAVDYSGSFSNIVNMQPINNLTVEYFLNGISATFLTYTLGAPILPYHIWSQHDYSTSVGNWNYTGAPSGYDTWNMNYSASSGYASGLVGTGPFMMNGGYGMPKGYMLNNHGWQLYVNPHYWVQYTNASSGLRQFTPKIYSVEFPYYTSLSNAVTAQLKGQVDTITEGVTPNFVPTVLTMPNTYIYHKPSSGYGYMQLNSNPSNAPFNITAFRQALNYATNKAYLASVVSSGYTVLGQPLIPPSDPLWRNDSTPTYAYNPQKAIQLISSIPGMTNHSGVWYYNGKPVKANIQITSAASNPLGVEGALLIAQWWTDIGVPTTITQEAFTTLVPNLIEYNFNVISLGITGISGDPTGDYFAFYNEPQGNGSGFYLGPFTSMTYGGKFYNSSQVTSLMNNLTVELNSITNLTKRIQISQELQGIAAEQSTMITLGYPVDILAFTNTTFVNISTSNTQPYAGYMYWAFLTTHKRATPLVDTYTSSLQVNVTANTNVVYNGQYGNVTVTVTSNTTGKPVSGATVFLGDNPSGALLNISSDTGVTNSNGQYTWEYQVLKTQSLIYTANYTGAVNISAVAYLNGTSSVKPGISSVNINVLPQTIKMETASLQPLQPGAKSQVFWVKVTNEAGTPISGFKYTLQALSGAVVIQPTSANQSVTYETTPFFTVNNTLNFQDNNLTSISGVTGSNGTFAVMVSANSTFNFAAAGSTVQSYLFLGDMVSGSQIGGAPGYMVPAEMTGANGSNNFAPYGSPLGFGVQQPVEFPVEVSQSAPAVHISLKVNSSNMAYDGSITVTATVTNTTTGNPVSGYVIQFLSQNVLGANRGYFVNSNGKDILASNPNNGFGSLYLPGLQITTNSTGQATVTFYPNLYTFSNASNPTFVKQPYGSTSAIPADMFVVSVVGANTTGSTPLNYTIVYSSAMINATVPASPTSSIPLEYIIAGAVGAVAVVGGAVGYTVLRKRKS